jgi:large subunit ribosomal protein L14e
MFQIGRVCMKLAGRDAGKTCVIIQIIDANTVLIDGQTRRRKSSTYHLEPTDKTVEIAEGASNADVVSALAGIGIECVAKKTVEVAEEGKEGEKAAPAAKKKPVSEKPKRKPTKKKEPAAKKSAKAKAKK